MSISKLIGDKRRWRAYKARSRRLPTSHRLAVEAIERYSTYFVPSDGDRAASMYEDLADRFEWAAGDGTPVRTVVGDDPAAYVESLVEDYTDGGYVPKRERRRLIRAITRAERGSGGPS